MPPSWRICSRLEIAGGWHGIPSTFFAIDDVAAEYGRLVGLGVRFTQPPTDFGPVTTAVFAAARGNLIQIAAETT